MSNLDDQDYEAIGRVVVACAEVEVITTPVLAAMMKVHEGMAQIAFSDRSHAWVLDALADAVNLAVTDLALQRDWLKWVRDGKGVNTRRNAIVHAHWLTPWKADDDTMFSARLMSEGRREGLSRRRRGLTMEWSSRRSLNLLAAAANDLSRRLRELVRRTPGLLAEGDRADS